ncbi:hypothetical protein F5X96DRAFT_627169, partial [Biscogniauxia mediterranea]
MASDNPSRLSSDDDSSSITTTTSTASTASTFEEEEEVPLPRPGLTRSQAFNLYLSHAFSTWNARGYEFAAVLFTAAAYPNTLVAAAL